MKNKSMKSPNEIKYSIWDTRTKEKLPEIKNTENRHSIYEGDEYGRPKS